MKRWITMVAVGCAVTLGAGIASADDILSAPHRVLGEGVSLVVKGQYRQAEPLLKQAAELDPMLSEAHYNLGVVARELGRQDEAILHFRNALALYDASDESNRSKCLYGIALATEAKGEYAASAQSWKDFIELAKPFASEQGALAVAREHYGTQVQASRLGRPATSNKAAR